MSFSLNQRYLDNGRHGIEPNTGLNLFSKILLNVFCMHKTDFFLKFFLFLSNLTHCTNKTRPGVKEFHFKKVGSIPHGFNTMGTLDNVNNIPVT